MAVRRLLPVFFLLLLAAARLSLSAMVAQDKVMELIEQIQGQTTERTTATSGLELLVAKEKDQLIELAQPLSLQLAVLEVTDSLIREMNLPKWQAMLRALGGDREILKRFAHIRPMFGSLEQQLSPATEKGIEDHLNQIVKLNVSDAWNGLWSQLPTLIKSVSNLYDWFDRYQRNAAVVNERTLRDFSDAVHGEGGLVTTNAIESIHKAVCPTNVKDYGDYVSNSYHVPDSPSPCSGGAFELLKNVLSQADNSFICSTSRSPQQLLYDFYALLSLTDAKAYAMMQFSWMLLRLYGKGNFTLESEMAREDFEHRVMEKAQAAHSALSHLSTWVWKCDTPRTKQIENETYIQFTELLQGYVVNEVDLNQETTCKESCSAYTSSQEKGCFDKKFCSKSRRCPNGRIYNCSFVEADSTVCTTNGTGRRYDWIEYKSGRTFGKKTECSRSGNEHHQVDSWWRWLFWHCSYCMCLCDQPGSQSDRYISLQPALTSTASRNALVTGVRFIKKDRIVHIQIQEGLALSRGQVNASSIQWKPIVPVTIPKYKEESLEDGPGYATLRYEERALDLDDLMAPFGHVITGLRFRKLGGHLNLEVQASPIDFVNGIVDSERSIWISNDNTPATETKPRRKLSWLPSDIPINSPEPSSPDSSPDTYIEFEASSLEKDVSQTTVPFLDATPVFPNPPTWLTGIGIYHKGQPGYGGFLAFRVSTINFTNYLTTSPSESLN